MLFRSVTSNSHGGSWRQRGSQISASGHSCATAPTQGEAEISIADALEELHELQSNGLSVSWPLDLKPKKPSMPDDRVTVSVSAGCSGEVADSAGDDTFVGADFDAALAELHDLQHHGIAVTWPKGQERLGGCGGCG